jgi:hypothetical protein
MEGPWLWAWQIDSIARLVTPRGTNWNKRVIATREDLHAACAAAHVEVMPNPKHGQELAIRRKTVDDTRQMHRVRRDSSSEWHEAQRAGRTVRGAVTFLLGVAVVIDGLVNSTSSVWPLLGGLLLIGVVPVDELLSRFPQRRNEP